MATPAFGDYISRKQVHQVCWKFLIPKVPVDSIVVGHILIRLSCRPDFVDRASQSKQLIKDTDPCLDPPPAV